MKDTLYATASAAKMAAGGVGRVCRPSGVAAFGGCRTVNWTQVPPNSLRAAESAMGQSGTSQRGEELSGVTPDAAPTRYVVPEGWCPQPCLHCRMLHKRPPTGGAAASVQGFAGGSQFPDPHTPVREIRVTCPIWIL